MYCPKCGTLNDQRALNCSRCGALLNPAGAPPGMIQPGVPPPYAPPMQPFPQEVPTYMAQSILVTLFCCLPLGIVGIMKASKIKKLLQVNDIAGALAASQENKKTLWIAFGVGIVTNIVYVLVQMNNH